MKRLMINAAGIAAVALLLTSCAGGTTGEDSAGPEDAISIGLVTSLTGGLSTLGVGNEAGVQAAVEKINNEGGINGRQLEVIVRDDKSDPNQSVIAFNEVIANDSVIAVIGSTNSSAVTAVAPQAERSSVPYIGLSPVDAVAGGEYTYSFIVPAPVSDYSKRLSEYWSGTGVSKIGIAWDSQDVYGDVGAKTTVEYAEEAGIDVAFNESFDPSASDFTPLLTKFKSSGAEGLIVWGAGPAPVIITKQFSELGLDQELYMGGAQASNLFLDPAGDAANGLTVAASMPAVGPEIPEGEQRTLIDEAVEAFGEEYYPTEFYFNGYSSVLLVAEALRNAEGMDREAVRDSYEKLDMVAPNGHYRLSDTNHSGLSSEDVAMTEVIDGAFVMTEFQREDLN